MTECYFLQQDLDELDRRIAELEHLIREIGREMGESCSEGAETYHDNFAFEDGERQQRMWTRRLRELVRVRERARLVRPTAANGRVALGRTVTVMDVDTGDERRFRVGSYMSFRNGTEVVSYLAPLARLLIGAEEGDVREGTIGKTRRSFEVVAID